MWRLISSFLVLSLLHSSSSSHEGNSSSLHIPSSPLPDQLLIGYASWSECDDKITTAVEQGVNVVIWFAINLLTDDTTGAPIITGGPNLTCVAEKKAEYAARGLETTHLISIGGWDAPHPDTTNPASAVYANWVGWNDHLFDGFDWDVEGNDDLSSPYNHFTAACLNLMGEMSQLAKSDGYYVTMAPAESYLDPTTSQYDHSLKHNYPEWETLQPEFHYHGRNTYGYLLQFFGTTVSKSTGLVVPTFDFVSIQLYESYSHAVYNVSILSTSPSDYLVSFIQEVLAGWEVDYSVLPAPDGLVAPSNGKIVIPSQQLVIGLANGWADGTKSLRVWPAEAGMAFSALGKLNPALQPRGFMFWDIADEGMVPSGTDKEMWMAKGLNEFLHTRPVPAALYEIVP